MGRARLGPGRGQSRLAETVGAAAFFCCFAAFGPPGRRGRAEPSGGVGVGFGSIWHWLVVLLIVVVVFGTGKLRHAGRDLGGAIREFKEGLQGDEPQKADGDQGAAGSAAGSGSGSGSGAAAGASASPAENGAEKDA